MRFGADEQFEHCDHVDPRQLRFFRGFVRKAEFFGQKPVFF